MGDGITECKGALKLVDSVSKSLMLNVFVPQISMSVFLALTTVMSMLSVVIHLAALSALAREGFVEMEEFAEVFKTSTACFLLLLELNDSLLAII